MSNQTFTVRVVGLPNVIEMLNTSQVMTDLDRITEAYTRKMANEAAQGAPVDTGRLRNSFPPSVRKEANVHWSFGSDVEYAKVQEYEHRSKKGFVRKAVWDNREAYRNKINERLGRMGQ